MEFSGALVQLCRWWEAVTFWSWLSDPCFFTPGLHLGWYVPELHRFRCSLLSPPVPGFQRRERSFPVVDSLALREFLLETHPRVPVSGLSTTALISITFCLKFSGVCFKHRILICTVNESHGKNEERDKTEGKRAVGKRSCKRWGKGSDNYNWRIRWHPQLLTIQINMKLSRREGQNYHEVRVWDLLLSGHQG